MNTATKKLRPYQVRLVTDVCRVTEDVLVEQPTGSGKTVQIVTLVAMHLGRRFSHAVISAPQEQIEQGFVQRDYQTIAFPECSGVAQPALAVPERLIRGARGSTLGSVKQIAAYLRQPDPLDYALACTHAALNQLTPDRLPADLTSKALFIDEAHHASADGLAQIVALWRERGGQLYFFTATPYRGDGRPVRLDGMRSFRRSLAEHMAEGFAPRNLESEIVALGHPGDGTTAAQFSGEEAPPDIDQCVAAICSRWSEDGKPKAIVRVPPMQGGKSGKLVGRLRQAFAVQGARILDATGTGAADKQRFLTALEAEKNRSHATSAYDVMLGIQRVLEGTDWPVCSAVYCVGMPGSLNTVVQFLGRAMRQKGDDYPAAHRDRARLVFFVPCGGGAALSELSFAHSQHALLTCCFLADHEVGQEWIVLREVRRGIEAALGRPAENPAAADAENEADEPLDPEVRAEVELVMANARQQIVNDGGEPTVGEVVQLAARTRPDLPEAVLHRVAAEVLAAQTDSTGEAVRQAIQQEIARRVRIDPKVKEAMAAAFAVVLEEFRDATLMDSAVLESVGRQVHGVTGGQMREFAQRLRDAAPRPLTEEQILAWADDHYERTGKWPGQESGEIAADQNDTWRNVNNALRIGLRGCPGGSSLALLLERERGVRNLQNLPPLTKEQILGWVDSYWHMKNAWPGQDSGPIHDAPGETWSGIDQALRLGKRGLAGFSSLASLLEDERGVRNCKNLPALTSEQILACADIHYERTGRWPKARTGRVIEASGETWMGLEMALQKGRRGLPGGSSLAQLLSEERNVRNHLALQSLTESQILAWADAHHQRTRSWPKQNSGSILDAPGETWTGVNVALAKGRRGLQGGSSLARLLAREARSETIWPLLGLRKTESSNGRTHTVSGLTNGQTRHRGLYSMVLERLGPGSIMPSVVVPVDFRVALRWPAS
jgi:superfamily II DNA or RNA helicase